MDDKLRQLRAAVARLAAGKPRSQIRYPDTFRRAAVKLAQHRLGQGASVGRLAREFGVSEPTLTKWLRPPAPTLVQPVAVTATPAPDPGGIGRPVLITPAGVRVESLDRDTLIAVLQALG